MKSFEMMTEQCILMTGKDFSVMDHIQIQEYMR